MGLLYYDSLSILVINTSGQIRRLYVPFRVVCINQIGALHSNSTLFVDKVFEDKDHLILYLINGNLYQSKHFRITILF